MDQAIEILAVEGSAKLIDFNPLRTHDIPLPSNACFVVANSLAESNKAAGGDYNTRVVECRLATRVMAKKAGVGKWEDMWRLGEFQTKAGICLEEAEEKADTLLKEGKYTKEEVCEILGHTEEEFE
jgi:N-acetylgalactosamine kinase